MNNYTVVGLDVYKKTIVAAVLPPGGNGATQTVRVENHPKAVEKLVNRLSAKGAVGFVYEAGPCGYEVWRQIRQMGHPCEVIAPGLTPVRPGDRVKTDRRDAEKLARLYRAGELTVIRIPTREEESVRDLVRVREDILEDRLRVRHRLSMFFTSGRDGCIWAEGMGGLTIGRGCRPSGLPGSPCSRRLRPVCGPARRPRRAWRA